MLVFDQIGAWIKSKMPKKMHEMLEVVFDEVSVRVRVLDRLNPDWNQEFYWIDVSRVCFKDEGIYSSDIILVSVGGREKPFSILTEAKGGSEFFGELTRRGLFPEAVWRKALGSTSGGLYCWPPRESNSEPGVHADVTETRQGG